MSKETTSHFSENSKVCNDDNSDANSNEKHILSSDNGSTEQTNDNNDKKSTVNIVKTLLNNSTLESNPIIFQSKILEYENLFSNRYTDESAEYVYESNKGITDPYISYNYGRKRFDRGNRGQHEYSNNRGRNRRNNDDRYFERGDRKYHRERNYKHNREER